MKNIYLLLLVTVCLAFASCDEGKIYPKDDEIEGALGRTVKFSVTFNNVDQNWPDESRYRICLAGYRDGSTTPTTYKDLSKPKDGEQVTYTFKNLDDNITTFAVSITRLSHKKVYDIYSTKVDKGASKSLDCGTLALKSLFGYVQTEIFDARCISCHGESRTSARLDLRSSVSYDMLVDVAAVTDPTRLRVVPGSSDESYLVDMLEKPEMPANVQGYTNHPTDVMVSEDMKSLLHEWINSGAGD